MSAILNILLMLTILIVSYLLVFQS